MAVSPAKNVKRITVFKLSFSLFTVFENIIIATCSIAKEKSILMNSVTKITWE
jgi:hypothetical protein